MPTQCSWPPFRVGRAMSLLLEAVTELNLFKGLCLTELSGAWHGRTANLVFAACVLIAQLTWQSTMAEENGSRESNSRGSGENSDCALLLKRHYIPHGQRDRGFNDPYSGTYGDGGGSGGDKGYYNDAEPHEVICIKYSDVNEAAREAKHRTNFIRPRGIDDPLPTERDIALTGELTLETTRILSGIDGLRKARDGGDLPNPRTISNFIHRDFDEPSPMLTILVMSWGQFIDHDLTLAAPPRDEQDLDFDCCGVPLEMQHPLCLTIDVSPKDPFYKRFNRRCIEFKRSLAGQRPNCALGPRTHINILSHVVDANFIYGSSDALSARLRAFDRGLMRTWDRFRDLGLKPILPPESENPERDCLARPRNLFCFIAGDERVNEQIHLTVLHTFYVRDHN
ncbi:peroxidasin-like, partial [Tropilaelaps mercedesae]